MAGQESHAHSSDQTSDHRRFNKGNGQTAATYSRDQIGAAANRAADLIQEHLDEDGDSLAWSLVNVMVSATDHLLTNPDATLADIFVENFGADPAAVMTEYGMA